MGTKYDPWALPSPAPTKDILTYLQGNPSGVVLDVGWATELHETLPAWPGWKLLKTTDFGADILALPFADSTIDYVVANSVIERVDINSTFGTMVELGRVTKDSLLMNFSAGYIPGKKMYPNLTADQSLIYTLCAAFVEDALKYIGMRVATVVQYAFSSDVLVIGKK